MKLSKQISDQLRAVYLSGNWVAHNLKSQLSDVSWDLAQRKLGSLNSIALLTYHINYYIVGISNVLEGKPLTIKDKYSFDLPPIKSQEEWKIFLEKTWNDADRFASLIESLSDEALSNDFVEKKYGNNYRNLLAMVEHTYYHLGQITLLKKILINLSEQQLEKINIIAREAQA